MKMVSKCEPYCYLLWLRGPEALYYQLYLRLHYHQVSVSVVMLARYYHLSTLSSPISPTLCVFELTQSRHSLIFTELHILFCLYYLVHAACLKLPAAGDAERRRDDVIDVVT